MLTVGSDAGVFRRFGESASWADIPTAVLHAEIRRRQNAAEKPECGSGQHHGSYNTSLHVFALLLILTLSVGACSFPIIVRRFPSLPVPHYFLFISRHFGTGVLIATAFVHLLPTAFVSMTDPCLPAFWNEGYPAMAGLIAMASVLVVVTIEMFFATRGAGHSHTSEYGALPNDGSFHKHTRHYSNGHIRPPAQRQQSLRPFRQADFHSQPDDTGYRLKDLEHSSTEHLVPDHSRSRSLLDDTDTTPRITQSRPSDDDMNSDSDLDLSAIDPITANAHYNPSHSPLTPSTPNPQKLLLQCLLLEAGILFHSIFIGLALSLAIGTSFIVLLVAISFHQTFEGLALGSRIAALPFPADSLKPWLMALAYGTTTPVGQAVGLMVHGLYDQQGQGGLLMVGITNAVSSGLLLFAGLVELLAEDFLSDASYEVLRGRRRVEAWGAVVAGGALMALVGAWA